MIAVIKPIPPATMFSRLANLRRQLERVRTEIGQLREDAVVPQTSGLIDVDSEYVDPQEIHGDLLNQLCEARAFIAEAIAHLTPAPEHMDCALDRRKA